MRDDEMILASEVALIAGVSEALVVKWRKGKTGPPYYNLGMGERPLFRYRRKEVTEWLESRRRNG